MPDEYTFQVQMRPDEDGEDLKAKIGSLDAQCSVEMIKRFVKSDCLKRMFYFASLGEVEPETCGNGHSRGYAWCNHCMNKRPCIGQAGLNLGTIYSYVLLLHR